MFHPFTTTRPQLNSRNMLGRSDLIVSRQVGGWVHRFVEWFFCESDCRIARASHDCFLALLARALHLQSCTKQMEFHMGFPLNRLLFGRKLGHFAQCKKLDDYPAVPRSSCCVYSGHKKIHISASA